MIRVLLFLHILGFVLWVGGAFAIMIASIAARKEDRSALGPLVRVQAAIYGSVVGPGTGVAVVTGLMLTFRMFGPDAAPPSVWLIVMQITGILAGIVMLALVIPTAGRLRRLEPAGPNAALFDALRNRQKMTGMLSGVLALMAMVAGVMAR